MYTREINGNTEYFDGEFWLQERDICKHCLDKRLPNKPPKEAFERTSLAIYAGRYCDDCWEKSGYRKEGYEGYDFLDAGEYYEEDDY